MRTLLVFQSLPISVTEWPRLTPNFGLTCRRAWKFAILVRLGGSEEFREWREPNWLKISAKCSGWLFEKYLAGRRGADMWVLAGVAPLLLVVVPLRWASAGVVGCPGLSFAGASLTSPRVPWLVRLSLPVGVLLNWS